MAFRPQLFYLGFSSLWQTRRDSLTTAATACIVWLTLAFSANCDEPLRGEAEASDSSVTSHETPVGTLLSGSSDGGALAAYIDEQFRQRLGGELPDPCDDDTFLRRVSLDILGRIPSVSERHDFYALPAPRRREVLVDQLVFAEGDRGEEWSRLFTNHWASVWTDILAPRTTESGLAAVGLRSWLQKQLDSRSGLNEIAKELADPTSEGGRNLVSASGQTTPNYTAATVRGLMGIRLECAQCHDHPFTQWKQTDFWGIAAFYGGTPGTGSGTASYEGETFVAKLLHEPVPDRKSDTATPEQIRAKFTEWLSSEENPYFAANVVNRVWQQLVGIGLVPEVDDLDQAPAEQRELLDEIARHFAAAGFPLDRLVASIMRTRVYQARSGDEFVERPAKVLSPQQVFASLEQALLLPVGQIDSEAARHNGLGLQMVNRLTEATSRRPDEYNAGVPQALLMMNGPLTSTAINQERGRLLGAVSEAPFFGSDRERIEAFFLALLTREPTEPEWKEIEAWQDANSADSKQLMGDIVWSLINSPEFVLCR